MRVQRSATLAQCEILNSLARPPGMPAAPTRPEANLSKQSTFKAMNYIARSLTVASELHASHKLARLHQRGVQHTTVQIGMGHPFRVRTIDRLAVRLFHDTWFEPAVRKKLQQTIRSGMTVFDIGANIGYYTVLMGYWVGATGRVIAVEPQPNLREELLHNVNMNGISARVDILQVALGSTVGSVEFKLSAPGNEAMGSLRNNGRYEVQGNLTLPMTTLDRVCSDLRIVEVSLLKMDTEGAELDILRGATGILRSERPPVIILEAYETNCLPFGHSTSDLKKFLMSEGYAVERLDDQDWIAIPQRLA